MDTRVFVLGGSSAPVGCNHVGRHDCRSILGMSAAVERLTIEAGKYHGLVAGETVPKSEVIEQAKANGYETATGRLDAEGRELCDDLPQQVEIPEQGELFGELWPDNLSNDLITQPDNTVGKTFVQWLDKKRKQNVVPYTDDDGKKAPRWLKPEHNWSHQQARVNFARAKDVDRAYWDAYDEFTTVLVTRTADENTDELLEQSRSLTPRAYYQSRYRLLKRLSDDYAAVEVRAPKYPTHPEKTVRTHVHTGIWLEGHHSADDFDLLKRKHMETVPGATDCHISVQHHSADTYPPVENGMDESRGATTALPYELAGENQPLMNVKRDASDLHDTRALEWCATLSAGSDGAHDTPGMSYWVELGNFAEYAETTAQSREDSGNSITQPPNTVGTKTSTSLDEQKPASQPSAITRANDALVQAVSALAQLD